jgi:hypothetical protein
MPEETAIVKPAFAPIALFICCIILNFLIKNFLHRRSEKRLRMARRDPHSLDSLGVA